MRDRLPMLVHTEASHGWGGQEIRILTECRWFRSQGFRCVLMAKPGSPIAARFADESFELVPLAFTRASQPGDFLRCARLFRQWKPALVGSHSNVDTRVALAAAAAAGVSRRVRYRHVSIPVRVSPWNRTIYRRLATKIVTTAESISNELEKSFSLPPGFVASIPTGVPDASDEDRRAVRKRVLEQHGLPETARLIVQVSVLREWKGHLHLIDAFETLAGRDPSLHLMIVGGGNRLDALRRRAGDSAFHERVRFTGQVADPYPYFQAADVAALASTGGEGVPQSTLQCFACARPFVGTTVGGIPDVVRDGANGLLVPPANPGELAAALGRILNDAALAGRLAAEARRTFETLGSVDRMGERLRDFLGL